MILPVTNALRDGSTLAASGSARVSRRKLFSLVLLALLGASQAQALTDIWQGTSNQNYTTASWNNGTPPPTGSDIVLDGYTSTAAYTLTLNAPESVNSLTFGTASDTSNNAVDQALSTTSASDALTITGGAISQATPTTYTGLTVVNVPIVLGENTTITTGSTTNDTIRFSQSNPTTSIISDGGNNYSVTLKGGGNYNFYADNTYGGGLDINNAYQVDLASVGAAGTGKITIEAVIVLDINANTTNTIDIDGVSTHSTLTNGIANATFTLGTINGAFASTGYFNVTLGNGTLEFTQGTSVTNTATAFKIANSATTNATGTALFDQAGTYTGPYSLGSGAAVTSANTSMLLNGAFILPNAIVEANVAGDNDLDTLGGFQTASATGAGVATGQSIFSGALTIANTSLGINLVSQNAGARTTFSGLISQATTGLNVNVNKSYSGSIVAGGGTTAAATYNPTGIVEFSNATGNTYTGTTTVYAGTLLASNTSGSATGSGPVSVSSGATIGGSGIINPTGTNTFTVASGATLAPGSIGGGLNSLTVSAAGTTLGSGSALVALAGAALNFNLGASHACGALTLIDSYSGEVSGLSGNTFNFTNVSGGTLSTGLYTLIGTDDSATNPFQGLTPGVLSGFTLSGLSGDSAQLQLNKLAGSGDYAIQLDIVAVPEASTWVMMLGVCALVPMSVFRAASARRATRHDSDVASSTK
jgi:autotransporter-associated beta strand protein